jgi:hypothetical protein
VWSLCPYHEDTKRPSLSITISGKYKGCYKCWTCGKRGRLRGDQLKTLKVKSGNDVGPNLPVKWDKFRQACVNNLKKYPLLKIQLAKSLNVSEKSLDLWDLGFDGESFTIPMVRYDNYKFRKNNYFMGMQKRYFDGTKKCVPSSILGYFLPRKVCFPAIHELYQNGVYTLFICEGWTDALAISDLGLFSIARPNCNFTCGLTSVVSVIEDHFSIYRSIVVPDNDKVGRVGAKEVKHILRDNGYMTYIFNFKGDKDIRDFILRVGKEKVKELLSYKEGYR